MLFCRRVFFIASLYGAAILVPMYFLAVGVERFAAPAAAQPAHYYGFVGGALAWQLVYLLVSFDPARFRPMIVMSALAKLSLVAVVAVLVAQGRTSLLFALPVGGDLLFGVLFLYAFWQVPSAGRARSG